MEYKRVFSGISIRLNRFV
jgi:hypothetical protein